MLSEEQVKLIEIGLTEDVEPRKVAAYLCLHMGLMLAEVTALQLADIDLNTGVLSLHKVANATGVLTALDVSRSLPMPPHVHRYMEKHKDLYKSSDCYILNGDTTIPQFYHMQNVLTSICIKYKVGGTLSASDLRNAFIRRCIQCDMDLYSICAYIGIKQPNIIAKRFAEYFEPKLGRVDALDKYSVDYEPLHQVQLPEFDGPKRMNLLILGAGSQGPVVKEIAEAIGIFDEIAFLDDDTTNKLAIDTCENYQRYLPKYPIAIPSFGDSYLREKWINRLEDSGFILPRLIDPSARVSTSAIIMEAVVVEAKSIISSGAVVSRGDIISTGAVLDVNSRIEEYVHIGAAATVSKNAVVPAYSRISSGAVVTAMGKQSLKQSDYYRKDDGSITDEQVDALNNIGMDWRSADERMWDSSYEKAKLYYRLNGNLECPAAYKDEDGYKLGAWIRSQRENQRSGNLSSERIARLDQIGMVWQLESSWEKSFEIAKAYYERNGNLKVIYDYVDENNMQLGIWIFRQRKDRREGKLSEDRIHRLNDIGMVWDTENSWEKSFEAAEEFYLQNGHLRIPQKYISDTGIKLGTWIYNQRAVYNKENHGYLDADRIKRLERIGMTWSSQRKTSKSDQGRGVI